MGSTALMADGKQQVTKLSCIIYLKIFGSDLVSECESYLLTFHWPKQVTDPNLSGMGKATPPLGGTALHMAIDWDV